MDGKPVLRNLQWRLLPGEHWAVLGENGSGKSTFLKLIRGEIAPAPGGDGRRVYALDGEEQITAVGIKELIALVSPELQSRYLQQEWNLNTLQVVHSGFGGGDYVYQQPTSAQLDEAQSILSLIGIKDLLSRNVQELSTGELRKVLIARALAGRPRVLICDEVCDGLDASSRTNLLCVLERVARSGTQLLLTTHRNEELIPAMTHRLVFRDGQIVECGALNSHADRRGLSPARKFVEPKPRKKRTGIRGERGNGRKVLIQIDRSDVFLNEKPVLHDINLTICAGQQWVITGANGAGKSTLLKLILGDVHPALGGRVRRFAFTTKNTIWEVKRRMGFVSPELQSNYREPLTGVQVIASGFFSSIGLMQKPNRQQMRLAAALARRLDLADLAEKSIMEMSYGEFRRILLARALVQEPDLLICDEPFDGLDVNARNRMAGILDDIAGRGTSLVLVTHHANDLPPCVTHVAELRSGRMDFQGTMERHGVWRKHNDRPTRRADIGHR